MRYLIRTLGCKANLYDSQILEGHLREAGHEPASDEHPAELCIVNSCAVTNEADRQSKKLAEKLARENPKAHVTVTGCGVEVDPGFYSSAAGVKSVFSNREKPRFLSLLKNATTPWLGETGPVEEFRSRHPIDREWPLPEGLLEFPRSLDSTSGAKRGRAFLKIQEGCDAFCSYCIIPYGRGPARSLEIKEVVERVRILAVQGIQEIVFTGTNLGDYGKEWSEAPDALAPLLKRLLEETGIPRIRLGSLNPTEITPRLFRLLEKEERLCPHLHVSLQSPLSKILRLMKRKYREEEVDECLKALSGMKRKNVPFYVGMDVITGFPGESEEDFEKSAERLEVLPWTRLHVFPYSERKGTPATRLKESVPQSIRKDRARRLLELSFGRVKEKALDRKKFPLHSVLIESRAKGPDGTRNWYTGHTMDYWKVLLKMEKAKDPENSIITPKPLEIVSDRAAGDVYFWAQWPSTPS